MVDGPTSSGPNASLLSDLAARQGPGNKKDADNVAETVGSALASGAKALGLPIAGVLSGLLSSNAVAGFESEGWGGKNVLPTISMSGGDGFVQKLWAALKKGGMAIQSWADGVMPGEGVSPINLPEGMNYGSGVDISAANLGTFSPPIVGDMSRSSGMEMGTG